MAGESLDRTKAVIYAVKSSPDEKESVADQQRLCVDAIERQGDREVIGTIGEVNQSGFRRSAARNLRPRCAPQSRQPPSTAKPSCGCSIQAA